LGLEIFEAGLEFGDPGGIDQEVADERKLRLGILGGKPGEKTAAQDEDYEDQKRKSMLFHESLLMARG
jgi:hypothetical protein